MLGSKARTGVSGEIIVLHPGRENSDVVRGFRVIISQFYGCLAQLFWLYAFFGVRYSLFAIQ